MAVDRAAPRRPLDGGGRRAHAAERVLHGRDRRRRLEDRELRRHLDADLRRPDCDRIDWRDRRRRTRIPNVIYVGTGSEAIRSNVILGRGVYKSTDAGKTWQFVGPEGRRPDRPAEDPSEESRTSPTWRRSATRSAWGPERGVYRTKDGGKTWQKVLFINDQTGAVSVAINWSNPNEIYAGAWRAQRKPWTIISGGPAAEGGVYKSTDGGDHWTRIEQRLPGRSDRQGLGRRRAVESEGGLRAGRSEGRRRAASIARPTAARPGRCVNSSPSIRARPFYFNKVFVNPKDENEVYVTELSFHRSTDGGRTFTTVPTPHGDDHVVWINPDNPKIFIETNDGGANITQDNGKSWSTQMNQPTAEFYMVDADEQFPYRHLRPAAGQQHGLRRQRAAVLVADRISRRRRGSRRRAARAARSGRRRTARSSTATAKASSAATTSRPGRSSTTGSIRSSATARTRRTCATASCGRRRSRSTRTIRTIVYHGSQYVHKTIDGGMHWTRFSPDVTANGPEGHVIVGRADHARHDRRRSVRGALLDALVASRAGRVLDRIERRPGVDDARQRQDLEERDAAGLPPGGRVHTIEDSPHRRGSAYVSVYRMYLNDFKPYLYMTNDYGAALDAADRRHQRHPGRPADARRARGSGAGRAALRRHARGRVRVVRSGQALADAAAEPAGDAGHRLQGPPRRSARVDDGAVVLDHGQRRAAAPDRGERHASRRVRGRRTIRMGRWGRRP